MAGKPPEKNTQEGGKTQNTPAPGAFKGAEQPQVKTVKVAYFSPWIHQGIARAYIAIVSMNKQYRLERKFLKPEWDYRKGAKRMILITELPINTVLEVALSKSPTDRKYIRILPNGDLEELGWGYDTIVARKIAKLSGIDLGEKK